MPATDPFPMGQVAKRPLAITGIRVPNSQQAMRCVVCLDSGADHCVFPAAFATTLGIDLLTLKKQMTGGVGSMANPTYYTDLEIALSKDIRFKAYVGFTPALDSQGIGLLGESGFFEYYKVSFLLNESKFTIETL